MDDLKAFLPEAAARKIAGDDVKDSLLAERHRANGARFMEHYGWRLPARFGSPEAEYRAVRSRAGLLDLCARSLVRFTGADRVEYLNGMVSNDLKALTPGTGTYAAVLNVQGKILADARVFCDADSFLMDLPEFLKDKILDHFNRHLVADEVEIEDLTERFGTISVQGPMSGVLLRSVFSEELPGKPLGHLHFESSGHEILVVRATHTGEDGYDLVAPAGALAGLASRIEKAIEGSPPPWIGVEAQEILRIEAGIPRYGIDMDENHLLLEAGLESHVNFHKGCYLGQEVVERIRSRGHVNKTLTGLVLEGAAAVPRGRRVYAEQREIGQVTSSVISPYLNAPIALAYIHRDFLNPGTAVACREEEQAIQAKIAALPFYRSGAGA